MNITAVDLDLISRKWIVLMIRPVQIDFTVCGLKPISEGHSFHYAGAPYKYLYGGVPYKSPKIAENRRKSPKIRAPGRPPRVTHIITDRKIKLRRPKYKIRYHAIPHDAGGSAAVGVNARARPAVHLWSAL
jgi:hypothetical protein